MQTIRLEHSHPEHNDWFVANWCLGNTCNYECSYCPEDLHSGTRAWPSYDTVAKFIVRLADHAQSLKKKLYIELTGGEVTLWKDFIKIAQMCRSIDVKLGFISNGSRTLRYWEENKHLFDHVCLSFHPEQADPEHFVQVVKVLNKELRTHVNIMMDPKRFNYCYEVAQKVKNAGNVSMALQPLIVDFGDTLFDYNEFQKRILDKQHELITKHIKWEKGFSFYRGAMRKHDEDGSSEVWSAHRFISQKQNNWSGWSCYSGVEQIIIDMNGDVYRGWCRVGDSLGTIQNPKFTAEPVVCDKIMCHCNYDIMSTKVKNVRAAQHYAVIPIQPAT